MYLLLFVIKINNLTFFRCSLLCKYFGRRVGPASTIQITQILTTFLSMAVGLHCVWMRTVQPCYFIAVSNPWNGFYSHPFTHPGLDFFQCQKFSTSNFTISSQMFYFSNCILILFNYLKWPNLIFLYKIKPH